MNIENMKSGLIYDPSDEQITSEQNKHKMLLYKYNRLKPTDYKKKNKLLKKMFGSIGENSYIEVPFNANFGGKHCFFGKNVYANSNLTCVDDGEIYVGDYTMMGPNVILATAGHPIFPELRKRALQYNVSIHIGNNCWLGSGVIVLPGVTIGDNSVIGAGSIVTKDIPKNVVAFGAPCKIVREINDHDKKFFFKDREINDC